MSYLIIAILFLLIVIFISTYYINGYSMLENFAENRSRSSHKGNIIEYYYNNNCPYCDQFDRSKIWDELKTKHMAWIYFDKYNKNSQSAKVSKYRIDSFPTIIITKNGNKVDTYPGRFHDKDALETFIKRYI
jgi:thioredoxin-related protein